MRLLKTDSCHIVSGSELSSNHVSGISEKIKFSIDHDGDGYDTGKKTTSNFKSLGIFIAEILLRHF